jgi:ATP-dependent Lon protease
MLKDALEVPEMSLLKPMGWRLPLLPLRGLLVYPSMVLHLDVGREKSIKALERAMIDDNIILLCTQSEMNLEEPSQDDIYRIGTISRVRQVLKLPNGTIRVLVEGMTRGEIKEYASNQDHYEVIVDELPEMEIQNPETDALMHSVLQQFENYAQLAKKATPELLATITEIREPGRLADVICSHLALKIKEKQEILETIDVAARLKKIFNFLKNEREVLELERKISQRVKMQMEKTQKEYYLREQMKAIQKELGEKEGRAGEADELRAQLKEIAVPEKVAERIEKEIDRLEKMPSAAAEGSVIRNYVDWLLNLPWQHSTTDDLDLLKAEQILNSDHYGMDQAKERVIEYLAVQKLVRKLKGPILCFVGPPGVGKTSLVRSIAKSLGRQFVRISLGGIRDEAEIRGHRRTYVGASPGRIIQGLKNAGTNNPVFLLDEIDKMVMDFRGDPASALLEVLDPEQNNTFSDHYVEIPFDLSNVMFITTANAVHHIPRPLLDRMEVIYIPGYTEWEKMHIAEQHLLPKQRREHGLSLTQCIITGEAILKVIREYTREAGVRNLEQKIAAMCRKSAKWIVEDENRQLVIGVDQVAEYLGISKYRFGLAEERDQVGVVCGLAWTEVGGDTLTIEVTVLPGSGKLTLTGKLGEVMKESAQAAFSYARAKSEQLAIPHDFHEKKDIHIHIPEGAIPKDGPSAGITIATALISALMEKPVHRDIAMTGEITLRGRVLPIGGLKEKALAAHRAGIKKVIVPEDNEKDLGEIPESIKHDIEFLSVSHMDQVLSYALITFESGQNMGEM